MKTLFDIGATFICSIVSSSFSLRILTAVKIPPISESRKTIIAGTINAFDDKYGLKRLSVNISTLLGFEYGALPEKISREKSAMMLFAYETPSPPFMPFIHRDFRVPM